MTKVKPKSKPRSRRLSRPLLDKMLSDLAQRLDQHVENAEAIERMIAPNGQRTVIEHQTRTAIGLMLECQLRSLSDIQGLARLLCRDGVEAP